MKKTSIIILYLLLSTIAFAQVTGSDMAIKTLFDNKEYQILVDRYAGQPRSLTGAELGYIAAAYYELQDAHNSLRYSELAVQKEPREGWLFNQMGTTLAQLGNTELAMVQFRKAIELSPREGKFYTSMGDAYSALEQYDVALEYYQKAIKQFYPSERAYYMIGATYANLDEEEKTLNAFYIAKSKIKIDKELLGLVIFNIGFTETENRNYPKAIAAFMELLDDYPNDYSTREKLMQCHHALDDYEKGDKQRDELYEAFKNGRYTSKVCMDNLIIGENEVQAYENFCLPENESEADIKYAFYIFDTEGNISYQIQFISNVVNGSCTPFKVTDSDIQSYGFVFEKNIAYHVAKNFAQNIIRNGE